MSRSSRRRQRRTSVLRRAEKKSWFRRYLRSLRSGVVAASIGTASIGAVSWLAPPTFAANATWIGNTSNQWSVPANWSALPATGDTLQFGAAGSAGSTLVDNLMTAATYNVAGITFDAAAPAYIVNPGTAGTNSFTLTGNVTNNSTATQTINDDVSLGAVRTVTSVAGGNFVFGGTLSGAGGITAAGPGAVALAGPVNYTGATTVAAGTLNISGAMGTTTAAGAITVGNTANVNGVLNISANITSSSNIVIGGQLAGNANGANAVGAVYQTAGTFNATTGANVNAFQLGAANNGYGYYKLSGGTLINNEVGIGGGNQNNTGAVGVMDVTGGTFQENGWITVARGQNQIGILNITGGNVTFGTNGGTQMYIGGGTNTAPYYGQISLTNATLTAQGNRPLNLAQAPIGGALGVFNLNAGGVLTIGSVTANAGTTTSLFNFNGGTLKPVVGSTTFMTSGNLTAATVYGGGGTIDNNALNITIANPLVAPTGSGVSAVAVSNGGAGYIGAPAVVLSGGSGIGATAVATINAATGVLTGITVTSPGSGYVPGDILTATLSGGGATTPATIGNISLATNVSGGVTFTGSGVTTLTNVGAASGQSTYTGATAINNGTLLIAGGAGVNGSSGITVGTASTPANLIVTSSSAVSPPVTLTNGTVNGALGTINSLTVTNSAGNVVTNGNNGTVVAATPLNIGNLTFSGAATFSPVTSQATASTTSVVVNTLTASGPAGSIKVSPISTSGGFLNGTYQLMSYTGSIGGTGFPAFSLNLSGLGVRQTATLTNPTGLIDLVVGGNSAVWTGALNGNWTITALAAPKNWALSSTSAPTDFVSGDAVLFDDTAPGTSNVNVTDANVQPAVVVFNNSGKDYTIGGNPIAGTGSIIMSGSASVTLNNANTFSGGVFVNSGKLNFGSASAIGTGRLTLQSGATIDNTSGAALTETTNNPQTWNGDINFVGTNSLNLGTGALTINAGASPANVGSTTINVAANTLTVGGAFTNPGGLGLFKTGQGNLALNGGGTFAGASRIAQGILTVGGGTLSFTSGAVPGLSAGFNTGESSSIFVNSGGTLSTSGEFWLGAAANTYGSVTVNGGIINAGTWFALGRGNPNLGGVGIANINAGGTINQNGNAVATTIGSFGTPLGGGIGQLTVNPGGTLTTSGTNGVFAGENEPGTLNVLGNGTAQATVTVGNAGGFLGLVVARNGQDPFGVVNLGAVGGTTTNNGIITTPAAIGGGGMGIFNFHGGTLRANNSNGNFMTQLEHAYIYGEGAIIDTNGSNPTILQKLEPPSGNGVTATGLTVSGTGYVDIPYVQISGGGGFGATALAIIDASGNLTGIKMTNPGTDYTSSPTYTLLGGGPNATGSITGNATLAPNVTSAGLIKNGNGTLSLNGNNTYTGGTTVNGGTIAINTPTALGTGGLVINAAGAGIDETGGVAGGGTKPIPALVFVSNTPETWNADLVYGGTRNMNIGGPISLGTNSGATRTITTNTATAGSALTISGIISNGTNGTTPTTGLTKAGAGNLIITGVQAYTGATTITAGALQVDGAGSVNTSSGITVNGATAKLLDTGSVAVAPAVTVTLGTLDGTGTISTATVANAAGAIVTNGNSTTAPLTVGSLTFNGAATMNLFTSPATAATAKIVTTNLTTNAAGKITINATNTAGFWDSGSYSAVSYIGAIGGAGFSAFQLPVSPATLAGLGGRQTAALDNATAGVVKIVIGGDRAQWTGTGDNNWDTTTHASKNFKLSSAGTATDFVASDAVLFDDTASGTTVNLAGNVAPVNTVFNNSTKNYTLQASGAFGITGGSVIKNGTGSLTISNANSYTGGTILNSGTLNINNAAAIGAAASALTLNGGTLDNTSGAAITLANNNPSNLNGNITFTGTSDLGLGTGRVTLVGNSSLNVAGASSTLSMGPIIGTGGLTKSGPGNVTITPTAGNAAANITDISGDLNVTGGSFNIGLNDAFVGGLTGTGTVANGSTTSRWITVGTGNNDTTFNGTLVDGAGATSAGGILGLRKRGSGTLTLTGASTLSDQLNIESGRVLLTGSIIPGNHITNGGDVRIGANNTPGITNGILDIQGGTLQARKDNAPSIQVGGNNGTYTTAGALRIGPGSTVTSPSEVWLGRADGGYGALDMTGGTFTIGSWFAVGRDGGQGVVNLSGGALNVTAQQVTIGSLPSSRIEGLAHGTVNISGGTFTAANNVWVGEQSSGVLNMLPGNGQLTTGQGLILSQNGNTGLGGVGIVNLQGGTITTNAVTKGGGTGIFNFNGGTLQAVNDNALFITGLTHAYTYSGGANIDSNGHNLDLDQVFEDPTGNGVSSSGLTVSGGGFISTPVVQISGGGGTGATAITKIDTAGNLTGITITNPGVGYTSAPKITLVGGGVGNTGTVGGTATLVPNVSGGLNKVGAGTLTVSNVQTYSGPTRVTQGTLAMGVQNTFSSSSTLQMAGGTLVTNGQNDQFAALQVVDNSLLNLGAGNSILNFGNSSALPWNTSKALTITNWTGSPNTAGGTDQLIFAGAGLTAAQRGSIHFQGYNGAVFIGNELVPTSLSTRKLGDFNLDSHVNAADVTAALSALTDFTAYKTSRGMSTDDFLNVADVDLSGFVSNADLQSLLSLLASGGGSGTQAPAVPEPETLVLVVMGALPGLLLFRKLPRGETAA